MPTVLYLTRNGLLEPLGQSQIFSYLRGLSYAYRLTVITYEKDHDRADITRVQEVKTLLSDMDIRWLPQRFLSSPKVAAPFFSTIGMMWLAFREVRVHGVCLIHARSYIPAAVALVVGRITGVPFIFDMRALWPEELITARRLRRGSLLHRCITSLEKICFEQATAVISLTHAALPYLEELYPEAFKRTRVEVIPTCVDLERFKPATRPPQRRVIGCLGTVLSGWFRLDWLAAFFSIAASRDPGIYFEITTRDDSARVQFELGGCFAMRSRLTVSSCSSEKVPEVLKGQIASVMFYSGGEVSELGRSPTRMAEILACGLPVVTNEGIGDVAGIIRDYRVGVLVLGLGEAEMNAAWDELLELLRDPDLQARCRRAAEDLFSLEAGTKAYLSLYKEILQEP